MPTSLLRKAARRGPWLALAGLCALSFAAPVLQTELDVRDQQALGKLLAKYFKEGAKEEAKEKAKKEITDALEKIGKKRGVKDSAEAVQNALRLTEDLGKAMQYSAEYKAMSGGKLLAEETAGEKLPYSLWLPKTYKNTGAPVPLVLCIPGTKDNKVLAPQEFLTEQLADAGLRDGAALAAVTMPADTTKWNGDDGIRAVMLTLKDLRNKVAIDPDRVYLLGRDTGVATALQIGSRFPQVFAGVIGNAGDAGEVGHANFHNLPTFFQGGGGQVSAFEAKIKEAGYNNCEVKADAAVTEIWAWMQRTPRVSNPAKVTFVPGVPIPSRAYWIAIPPTEGVTGVVTAEADRGTNTIVIHTPAVRSVTVYYNNEIVDLSKPVKIVINGSERQEKIVPTVENWLALFAATNDPGRVYVERREYDVPK